MKKQEWNEALNHLDTEIVEKYVLQKDELRQKKRKKTVWFRAVIIAACLAVAVGVLAVMLMPKENDDNIIPTPDGSDGLSIINPQAPSLEPIYYGSPNSMDLYGDAYFDGPSVIAEFVEALPDVYTVYDDWGQKEIMLIRMKTVKLLSSSQEMPEEFYYMVPVAFMTDFSLYDSFIIKRMGQASYEYAVLYNKTKGEPEQIHLAMFSYSAYGTKMGEKFIAFDEDGNFDRGLWESNDKWREFTKYDASPGTLKEVAESESAFGEEALFGPNLLKDLSGEAVEVLEYIKSFENGIFVPGISYHFHSFSPEVQFHATRYINGFATNESASIWDKYWQGGNEYSYEFSKAHFSEEDLKALPDLRAAITTVADAYDKGEIHPPHIKNYEELSIRNYGIFGWYAKTDDGVIGIVRVSFCYSGKGVDGLRLDDAYYIIEYGSNTCKPIDRDALLERLGECESTYIYTGEYNERGKDMVLYG